jgi:hypothetical protein
MLRVQRHLLDHGEAHIRHHLALYAHALLFDHPAQRLDGAQIAKQNRDVKRGQGGRHAFLEHDFLVQRRGKDRHPIQMQRAKPDAFHGHRLRGGQIEVHGQLHVRSVDLRQVDFLDL